MKKGLFKTSNLNISPREYYIFKETENHFVIRMPINDSISDMINGSAYYEWKQNKKDLIKHIQFNGR